MIPMDNWGAAQYGLEATMPRGFSGKSEAELKKMDVRERKQLERLSYMRFCVHILESFTNTFADLRTNIIYDHILDGWTYRQIASELGVGVTYVKERKHRIIDIIVKPLFFSQFIRLNNRLFYFFFLCTLFCFVCTPFLSASFDHLCLVFQDFTVLIDTPYLSSISLYFMLFT